MCTRSLAPVDGSATAARGLREALGLARAFDALRVPLSAIEHVPVMLDANAGVLMAETTSELQAEPRRILAAARDTVQAAGIASESPLADAAAARVSDLVVEHVRAHRCDLIVMGTHGRRGVRRLAIGSDAAAVVRLGPLPVPLVRADETARDGGAGRRPAARLVSRLGRCRTGQGERNRSPAAAVTVAPRSPPRAAGPRRRRPAPRVPPRPIPPTRMSLAGIASRRPTR